MKQIRSLIAAALLFAGISPAIAQTFPTVPSSTVIGRTAIGTGPSQAIPFATLLTQLGAVPTSRSILTTAPLAGGGNLTADRTLSITALGIDAALLAANAVTNAKMATMPAFTFKGNNTSGAAVPTDVDIAALTSKGTPTGADLVIISDQAASGAWKKATVASIGSAGTVSSIAGNTGAFTLGGGITNTVNQIRLANNGATLSGSPANPSGAGAVGPLMMGLGSTCTITPVFSTRVRVSFTGVVFNNTNGNVSTIGARFGTGAAPANGAASTGTSMMNSYAVNHPTANIGVPFPAGGVLTGLTAGTAYWIDMTLGASANTSNLTGVSCQAFEF